MDRTVTRNYYVATYTGRGEFYTGIRNGAEVLVEESVTVYTFEGRRRASVSIAIQDRSNHGAWMCLYDRTNELESINPFSLAIHGRSKGV